MTLDSISIGNRIEITLKRDEGLKTFASLVEKVDSDKKEVLAYMPISYGKLIKLPMTEKYVVVFFTEKGMFKFDCVVVEYLSEGEFHFMKLKIINDGLKVQRREYFRFNCLLPVKFEKIEENEETEEVDKIDTDLIFSQGIIKDLGAGGIRFLSNVELDEKDRVKVLIQLNDMACLAIAEVLNKQFFPKSNYKYQYRVEFKEIKDKTRETIIKYIFEEQRKLARKNRGILSN